MLFPRSLSVLLLGLLMALCAVAEPAPLPEEYCILGIGRAHLLFDLNVKRDSACSSDDRTEDLKLGHQIRRYCHERLGRRFIGMTMKRDSPDNLCRFGMYFNEASEELVTCIQEALECFREEEETRIVCVRFLLQSFSNEYLYPSGSGSRSGTSHLDRG